MLGHVELDLIIVDKDLLEVGLQIVPAELARALKINPSRRLERGCKPFDRRALVKVRREVSHFPVTGFHFIDNFFDLILPCRAGRRAAVKKTYRQACHSHQAHGRPSSIPTRFINTSRRPSRLGGLTMPSCSIISTSRAARGYPMRRRRCRKDAEACPVVMTTSFAFSYMSS